MKALSTPLLSVLIVNWNTKYLLLNCLQTVIEDIERMSPEAVEVIVVDNGSDDGSLEAVRERYPYVRVIANSANRGFAAANNQGLLASSSEYVLLLNSDTRLTDGVLQALTDFAKRHEQVGAAGCQLLNEDGSPQASIVDFPSLLSAVRGNDFRNRRRPFADGAFEVDAIVGACLLVRRSAVAQVGPMDEDFAFFAEEVDWCYRLRQAGWLVCWLPHVQVLHLEGQSRKRRPWYAYKNLHRSRLLFFKKHYGLKQARTLRLGYFMSSLTKVVYHSLRLVLGRPYAQQKLRQNISLFAWLARGQDVLP